MPEYAIGTPQRRIEGGEKVLGRMNYVADVQLAGALSARIVTSPYPRARILRVESDAALRLPGVLGVYTAQELGSLGLLADKEVFYAGEAVAVVVAEDARTAEDAASRVTVRYERLPALLDPRAAMAPDAPLARPLDSLAERADAGAHGAAVGGGDEKRAPNVCGQVAFSRGNLDEGFRLADIVVEGSYRIAAAYQGYLEPHGSVAVPAEGGGVTVYTTTQGQFSVREEVAVAVGLPEQMVKVVGMQVGGGFGAKFVKLEPLAARLALLLERPVRIVLDRGQDFLLSRPGQMAEIEVKIGARSDGTLTALQAHLLLNAGAQSDETVGIAGLMLGSTYRVPNLDVRGYEVLTNTTPTGAYRAPGAPQAYFALESAMDSLARKLSMDPIELRLRSAVRAGDPRVAGGPWPTIGLEETLEATRSHPFWQERRKGTDEGYGVAVGGWLGGTEPAAAACRINGDGSLTLQVGSIDITGTNTTFAAIAAEVFGLRPNEVRVVASDTDAAPYAGASGGSKITYTVGAAVQQAAQDARAQLLEVAAGALEASPEDLDVADGRVFVRGAPTRALPIAEIAAQTAAFGGRVAPIYGRGRTAIRRASPGFAVHAARVHVDRSTGRIRPLGYLAVQDVGRALNPAMVEGQIRGGVVQGIGRALFEEMRHDEQGQLASASFLDYALPRAADVPDIAVALVEIPSEHGPFGAKGVGEPPAIPGAATIANAVEDAVGARVTELPLRPEAVLRALRHA
ncbi:MAG: xanthine dehydrogenase family protein molybdopterin-binding subunit [Thermaerobacter sp.]|nr:xanthine dehydrogenase family protein molybdopterin-binding subunit [Thermaerobacter sp.]